MNHLLLTSHGGQGQGQESAHCNSHLLKSLIKCHLPNDHPISNDSTPDPPQHAAFIIFSIALIAFEHTTYFICTLHLLLVCFFHYNISSQGCETYPRYVLSAQTSALHNAGYLLAVYQPFLPLDSFYPSKSHGKKMYQMYKGVNT